MPDSPANDGRKTPEERNKMTDLERLRHSCAHVLATAILRIWPEAQFAAGPPVENGFYYDVELEHRITPEDFPRIEEEMKKEIKANRLFERKVVPREQAMQDAQSGRLGALKERSAPAKQLPLPPSEPISNAPSEGRYRSGQTGRTVNPLAYAFAGSNPALPTTLLSW